MRVTVTDDAGNVAQGNPTRLSATSAKVGRRFRRSVPGRVKVPFGRRASCAADSRSPPANHSPGQTIVATVRDPPPRRAAHPAGTAVDGPPRPLLDQGARRPEPHLSPRLRRLRRRARRRPRRFGPRARLEHDPRVAHAPLRPRPRALQRPPAHAWPAYPGPRPLPRPPGPRARPLAHVRGHAHEPPGPLAPSYSFSGRPGATRSASASAASRTTRSSSATRERRSCAWARGGGRICSRAATAMRSCAAICSPSVSSCSSRHPARPPERTT